MLLFWLFIIVGNEGVAESAMIPGVVKSAQHNVVSDGENSDVERSIRA